MKYGFKEIRIDMGMFDFSVICIIGDYANIEKYVDWKYDGAVIRENKMEAPKGQCIHLKGYVPLIWIPRMPKTPDEYATLSHEALHATFHMLDWAGIPRTPDTEEVITHGMTHIISTILSKK